MTNQKYPPEARQIAQYNHEKCPKCKRKKKNCKCKPLAKSIKENEKANEFKV